MKDKAKQTSPHKIKYPDGEQLTSQQKYQYLLNQLTERNNINDCIIRKFVQRCNKKYHKQTLLRTTSTIVEAKREENELEDEQQRSSKVLPSKIRFHTEAIEERPSQVYITNRIQSITDLDSNNERTERKVFVGKVSNVDQNKTDKNISASKTGVKDNVHFKKYMRNVYMKEIIENKAKQNCHQQHSKCQKMIERRSTDTTRPLNIKSIVFGNEPVTEQENMAPAQVQKSLKPITYNNCYQSFSTYKIANLFLPNISRQNPNPNIRPSKRQKLLRPDKIMKIIQTEPNQRNMSSRCRALWLAQSTQRVGSSFRVNTIQLTKQ